MKETAHRNRISDVQFTDINEQAIIRSSFCKQTSQLRAQLPVAACNQDLHKAVPPP